VTIVFFAAQVAFSNWWLKSHRFGPMEWLWRGMTYGKFPSMTKEEALPMPANESAETMAAAASGNSQIEKAV
jgi:uncharacterized protein